MRVAILLTLAIGSLAACGTAPSPGPITFGPPDEPETTFPLDAGEDIEWVAVLSRPVDETSVNLVISPQGTETETFGYRQFVTDPGSTRLANEMPLGRFITEPGVYVMRYVSLGGDVLAEGEFELVADSP